MDNKELIYEMAKRLDMAIEVTKNGEFVGRYKFIDGKLHKQNITPNEKSNSTQGERISDRRN